LSLMFYFTLVVFFSFHLEWRLYLCVCVCVDAVADKEQERSHCVDWLAGHYQKE